MLTSTGRYIVDGISEDGRVNYLGISETGDISSDLDFFPLGGFICGGTARIKICDSKYNGIQCPHVLGSSKHQFLMIISSGGAVGTSKNNIACLLAKGGAIGAANAGFSWTKNKVVTDIGESLIYGISETGEVLIQGDMTEQAFGFGLISNRQLSKIYTNFSITINGKPTEITIGDFPSNDQNQTTSCKIYNLGDDIVDGISLYCLPIRLSSNFYGHNEVSSGVPWLLLPQANGEHKISVILDGEIEVPLLTNMQGESPTNPFIYRRYKSPFPRRFDINGVPDQLIYPLYGSNDTIVGDDWHQVFDPGPLLDETIFSHPASANFIQDHRYLHYQSYNYQLSDSISIALKVNDIYNGKLYIKALKALSRFTLVLQDTIFEKKITPIQSAAYYMEYEKYTNTDKFGVRF
jgi:hypothetical protein